MRVNLTAAVLLLAFALPAGAVRTVTEDKDWDKQAATLHDTVEAEWIVRLGDVDQFGFGWPEGFDPFCGRMTDVHEYPWEPKPGDVAGLDRILLSSRYRPEREMPQCSTDGYSSSFDAAKSKPVALTLPLEKLAGAKVSDAWLQLFIDDFQAPSRGSKFVVTLNGRRFTEAEHIINAIDQTGPVGKLITLPIPEEFHADLTARPALTLLIDEVTGCADGFALDFARLLVNRRRLNTCKGVVTGRVASKSDDAPIAGARVFLSDKTSVVTDAEGRFRFPAVPAGFELIGASKAGYADGSAGADVGPGEDNPEVLVLLEPGKALKFADQSIKVGQAVDLKTLLFDMGKAELKPESLPELDRVVALLAGNPGIEIELSGHTSSEGEAQANRSLSYRRVKACRDYIASRGIDPGRISAVGHGPDMPVAPNDTEPNRKRNRRVELRVTRE